MRHQAMGKSLRIIGYVTGVLILLLGIFFIYANSMIKAFSGWISLSAATLLAAVGIAIVYVVRRTEQDKYSEKFSAKR
jgi:protein-S-isoprenylcysteine O-methyltransferase Ste14